MRVKERVPISPMVAKRTEFVYWRPTRLPIGSQLLS
jgi:hypothetical protein